ncbi:MAG: VOC family protein [Myxococcaceae bacterium]
MAEITKHMPGMLSWADLMTRDVAAAKRFYSDLFGWKTEDTPLPEGGVYVMARQGGKDVAAMSEMSKDQIASRMPPHWNTYFAVDDVDQAAKRVGPAGGKLVMPPFDVLDAGRMTVVEDPSGAIFSLWQAKRHIGASRMGEHGALVWTELETNKVDACRDFYTRLFGWKTQEVPMPEGKYTVFQVGEKGTAGMMAMSKQTPPGTPSHWTVYFAVRDCDALVQSAKALGAKIVVPPTDIPNTGRFAMIFDPQGAFFAVLQPAQM